MRKLKNKKFIGFFIVILISGACGLNLTGQNKDTEIAEDLTVEEQEDWIYDTEIEPHPNCTSNVDCDDGEPCNGNEVCDESGNCISGEPLADDSPCQTNEIQQGKCKNSQCVPINCGNRVTDEGEECDDGANGNQEDGCRDNCTFSCSSDNDCIDDLPCTSDKCEIGGNGKICTNYSLSAGSPCEDGYSCTIDDTCDSDGNCYGTESDEECTVEGSVCRPLCFSSPSGCGLPPETLTLTCPEIVELSSSTTASCEIGLDSMTGQTPCIECETKIGRTILDYSDFSNSSGECNLDSWTLISGNNCRDAYDLPACPITSTNKPCCDNLSAICYNLSGDWVLRSDKRTNCNGIEEWRITKTFDTTGLSNLKICLDIGKPGGITNDEFLVITVSDGTNTENVACLDGDEIKNNVVYDSNNVLFTKCYPLPDWAQNNPSVTITISADSSNDTMFIDDILITGEISGCTPNEVTLFQETFSGCPDLTSNGWTVSGNPICPGTINSTCSGTIEANGSSWTIERDVDTTGADGEITLSFDLVDHQANDREGITVEFSTDNGLNWKTVWREGAPLGKDDTCHTISKNLSILDPKSARNPALKIKFVVNSNDKPVDIGNIRVTGLVFCDSSSILSSNVTESGGGKYELSINNSSSTQITALISCKWDDLPEPPPDISYVTFTK